MAISGEDYHNVFVAGSQSIIFSWIAQTQCAKKFLSNSPGLVDFPVGLVDFIHHLPDEQVTFWTFYYAGEVRPLE